MFFTGVAQRSISSTADGISAGSARSRASWSGWRSSASTPAEMTWRVVSSPPTSTSIDSNIRSTSFSRWPSRSASHIRLIRSSLPQAPRGILPGRRRAIPEPGLSLALGMTTAGTFAAPSPPSHHLRPQEEPQLSRSRLRLAPGRSPSRRSWESRSAARRVEPARSRAASSSIHGEWPTSATIASEPGSPTSSARRLRSGSAASAVARDRRHAPGRARSTRIVRRLGRAHPRTGEHQVGTRSSSPSTRLTLRWVFRPLSVSGRSRSSGQRSGSRSPAWAWRIEEEQHGALGEDEGAADRAPLLSFPAPISTTTLSIAARWSRVLCVWWLAWTENVERPGRPAARCSPTACSPRRCCPSLARTRPASGVSEEPGAERAGVARLRQPGEKRRVPRVRADEAQDPGEGERASSGCRSRARSRPPARTRSSPP